MNSGRPREGLAAATERRATNDGLPSGPHHGRPVLGWGLRCAASRVRVRARRTRMLAPGAERTEGRSMTTSAVCSSGAWRMVSWERCGRRSRDFGLPSCRGFRPRILPRSLPTPRSARICSRRGRRRPLGSRTAAGLVARLDSLSRRNPQGWSETFNLVVATVAGVPGQSARCARGGPAPRVRLGYAVLPLDLPPPGGAPRSP